MWLSVLVLEKILGVVSLVGGIFGATLTTASIHRSRKDRNGRVG